MSHYIQKGFFLNRSCLQRMVSLGFLFGVLGCSSQHILIASSASYRLQSTQTLQQSFSEFHRIHGRVQGRSFVLTTKLEAQHHSIVIAGVSPIGRRLFLLILRKGKLSYQPSPGFRLPLSARKFLALMQLVLWPVDVVQKGLLSSTLRVQELPHKQRLFLRGKRIVIKVLYQKISSQRRKILYQHRERKERFVLEIYRPNL